jgi:anhydro-N-acetylmuramic acid kinase
MTPAGEFFIGLMSGTSLDGMDAALARFDGDAVELVGFVTRPYAPAERDDLEAAMTTGSARELALLHARVAEWAAEATAAVLASCGVRPAELTGIGFHGQTVWHEPPAVTWQLGAAAVLAERFGVPVVSDFRARDVAAGGQGAPLVPMADVLLFGATDHPRVLLNIGGMANVTWVERRGEARGAVAFDTGPGMAVIDGVARLVDPALPYDRDGALAARGQVNEPALAALLLAPFFDAPPPKSTGRELFGAAYAAALYSRIRGADAVATAAELTARTITDAVTRLLPFTPEVLASGGGCHHPVVWTRLSALLGEATGGRTALRRFDDEFFPGDAKEAVAFALLARLTLARRPGNLPAATGAAGARVLGSVTLP